jgi:hypothetical protein
MVMEVHHHSHTERKKWTHYFWEFFMLFLAVFCGFLAENQREHFVEHQREKQYMISLVEDLQTDTAELRKGISRTHATDHYIDSVLIFLSTHKISDPLPFAFSQMMATAGQRLSLINTDRTSSQLKNSGAMRLIRKKKVTDSIIRYWNQVENTNITLERYLIYRNAGRELSLKLFMWPEVDMRVLHVPPDSIHYMKIIDPDPKKWDELKNLIGAEGVVISPGHLRNLDLQLNMAIDLIALIKKEYHLK